MKKILSVLLLMSLLLTVVLPASVATAASIEQSPRDDVLILFDGSYEDIPNLALQYCYANPVELSQDNEFYLQGSSSMLVDMPGSAGRFEQQDFVFGLILTLDEITSIKDFPISELSVYNHMDTKDGDRIQINYVDPENEYGHLDDSYNKDFDVSNLEPGWNLLRHDVMSSALYPSGLNPDNIDHIRFSWRTDKENYTEVDWSFDCLILAKQSFFDDRAAAEEEITNIIQGLEVPTADTFDSLKDEILSAKKKLDNYFYEFPNFLCNADETVSKMKEVWAAYSTLQAQASANSIIGKIDLLGDITIENYEAKKAELDAIAAELDAYIEAGYKKNLITNLETFDAACLTVERLGVEIAIDALPAIDTVTSEDAGKIREVEELLAGLDAGQQELIPAEKKDKLLALTAKLVENTIRSLPNADDLTLNDEESLLTVQASFEALSDAGKSLVSQDAATKLEALLVKLEELKDISVLGLVNADDRIDASDALMVLQHSVQLIILEDDAFRAADVDGNERIDAADALLILQYSVKLIDSFPAAKIN